MSKRMLVDEFAELSAAVVRSLPRDMDSETIQAWILDPDRLKVALAMALLLKPRVELDDPDVLFDRALESYGIPEPEYFTPLQDIEVPEIYRVTLAKYRKLAQEHGVPASTPICYHVRAGFTLKSHAPEFGPCHDQFGYLQNWNFWDEPTQDSFVFWVPRLLAGSTSSSTSDQIALLAEHRLRLELPKNHMSSFGQVGLVAGLILAHLRATGERIPLIVRTTDSCYAVGFHLDLYWLDDALYCAYWDDDTPAKSFGVFALGVEELGT